MSTCYAGADDDDEIDELGVSAPPLAIVSVIIVVHGVVTKGDP